MKLSTLYLIIGISAALIGAWGLANPGGWDAVSAANLFLGGFLIGTAISGQ